MKPDTRNRAFQGAYRKGWDAFKTGEPVSSCPYSDLKTHRGSVTFSRAFWRYWKNGWNDAKEACDCQRPGISVGCPVHDPDGKPHQY